MSKPVAHLASKNIDPDEPVKVIDYEEGMAIRLPDGRIAHLWHHDCDDCTSLDVWTTTPDGRDHPISANTGDKKRAAMGMFTFDNGRRRTLTEAEGEKSGSHATKNWPAVGTVVLLWNDKKKGEG